MIFIRIFGNHLCLYVLVGIMTHKTIQPNNTTITTPLIAFLIIALSDSLSEEADDALESIPLKRDTIELKVAQWR